MQPIVIYGAGGFAREVHELIRDINHLSSRWSVSGFLSDDSSEWGASVHGLPVLEGIDWLRSQDQPPAVALGIGSPVAKKRIVDAVADLALTFPTLIHPTVTRSQRVELERGVIVTAGCILTVDIRVRAFTMLNLMSTVGHDAVLEAFTSLSPGSRVSGNVRIGEGCDVGTSTTLIPGVTVGEWSVIGAGAVVTGDMPADCTAVGVPARVIRTRDSGWHLAA